MSKGSTDRYPAKRLREIGAAWKGDGSKPAETRQRRRARQLAKDKRDPAAARARWAKERAEKALQENQQ